MPAPALPTIGLAKTLARSTDVLVVGFGPDGAVGVPAAVDQEYRKRLGRGVGELAAGVGAKPAAGHTRTLPSVGDGPRVVVVGLGDGAPTPEDLRRTAGTGVRQAAGQVAAGSVSVALSLGADEPETLTAVAEGALIGSYRFTPVGSAPKTSGSSRLPHPARRQRGTAPRRAAQAGPGRRRGRGRRP